jgi:mono/diheme cytochrome c family protein
MLGLSGLVLVLAFTADSPTEAQKEFFEQKIRPVLVQHCYKCHSDQAKNPKGDLRVDSRAALLAGGETGPSLVPKNLEKSKLIEAIRYKNPDLLMPPNGKLSDAAIKDLETWVMQGAPWPGGDNTTVTKKVDFDLKARKESHWCWQPLSSPPIPKVENATWPRDSIDHFILAKLESKKLAPAKPAEPLVWLRRVTYAITGLPPSPEQIRAFEKSAKTDPTARAKVVDQLLASPQFGERWGRHWLDLVRYAESRGHEFDPDIPNAYQYRDYVVRALNADVPYNQFVLEQLAGDLLKQPRLDSNNGTNESILGPGFWHLGEEVHSPVDIRQDQADRLDNRIDVLTKTFLGLTVSCARCHDHKFDAISTKDYYAIYGLLEGSSFRLARFDGWKQNRLVAEQLAQLRQEIDAKLAQQSAPTGLPKNDAKFEKWLSTSQLILDYAAIKPSDWKPDDVSYGSAPRQAGTWSITLESGKPVAKQEPRSAAVFDKFWSGLKLAPQTSGDVHALSKLPRAGFSIRTPNFQLNKKNLYFLVRGSGKSYAAVDNHTIIAGPLHGALVKGFANAADYRWVSHELNGYIGQQLHVEFTADPKTDFAIAMVVQSDEPPPSIPPGLPAVSHPLTVEKLKPILEEQSAKEAELRTQVKWESRLGLSLWEGSRVDEKVFVRGNPRSLGEHVSPRWPEAISSAPKIAENSGRLELAQQLIDPKQNPFIARVAVNRVWHHLFGRGLVASPDNFGVLGEAPTHPELLDHLSQSFIRDGWSMKRLIRELVLSSTFAMNSNPDAEALKVDPTNQLLHHFRSKRLEGEAIRDSVLAISGRLNLKMGGPSVPIYLTPFLDGRGRPGTGPLDGAGRRSLYLAVRRNFVSPFMLAFDTPSPFSTVGKRQVSNVPAQALILLNDPFIHEQSQLWAKRIVENKKPISETLAEVYLAAYGRAITPEEERECVDFLKGKETDQKSWAELLHTLLLVKEFIFVR